MTALRDVTNVTPDEVNETQNGGEPVTDVTLIISEAEQERTVEMDLLRRLERLELSADVQRPAGECGLVEWRELAPGEALPICGEHVSACWLRISPETVASAARVLVDIGQASTLSQAIENLGGLYIPSLPGWRPPIEEAKAILGMEE